MADSRSLRETVLVLGGVAMVVAALRYFLKDWLDPLGVPVFIGSFLASVTVVLLIAVVVLFSREGRAAHGRYLHAAAWFFALAAWCEVLVISGILITEKTEAKTYYQGPWHTVEEIFPTGTAHALGHTQGFLVRALIGLILGAAVYLIARRHRPA